MENGEGENIKMRKKYFVQWLSFCLSSMKGNTEYA